MPKIISGALSLGAKKLFCDKSNSNCLDKVQITTLSTSRAKPEEQPTTANCRRAFADVAARAKPEDIIVVYLAGHGVSFGNGTDSHFYLTKEAQTASADELAKVLKTSTTSSEELTDWLTPNKDNEDDLKLIPALKMLDAESGYEVMQRTGKGEPKLIYIDDDKFSRGGSPDRNLHRRRSIRSRPSFFATERENNCRSARSYDD